MGFLARYAQHETFFRGQQPDEEFNNCLTKVYKAILLFMMAFDNYLQHCKAGLSLEIWVPDSNK